ncbi:hypothetical protein DERP_007556, partial [Dermatophagoides pteronyssinus]
MFQRSSTKQQQQLESICSLRRSDSSPTFTRNKDESLVHKSNKPGLM